MSGSVTQKYQNFDFLGGIVEILEYTSWPSIKTIIGIKVLITCLVGPKLVYCVLEIARELV
jgi:hypothetical protein